MTDKGGVFLLGVRELLGIERQWSPRTVQELLYNCTQVSVRSIHREQDGSIRLRMKELWNGGEKILGSGEGGVKSLRPKERLPRPFKSIYEGESTLAAPGRNFL